MTCKKHLSAAVCVLLCVLLLCSCGQGAAPSPGADPVPEEPTEQSSDETPVPAKNGGAEEPESSETADPVEPAEEELPAAYDPLPAGAGALVLTLKGDDLVIGTDENMTKENGKPMFFSQISDNGSFLMTENGFEKAQRTRLYNGEEHIEGFDVCLRAYTASSGNE
ncbi:MAG: hypothetical protein IKH56_06030 [Oscillospiraceae bacterium]|nr:hypothetical protein [Oscillospiraceae bacterium]